MNVGSPDNRFAHKSIIIALRANDTDLALRELQAYLEGLPYVEGFKKKLEEPDIIDSE